MQRGLIAALVVVVVAAALTAGAVLISRADDDEASAESIKVTSPTASVGISSVGVATGTAQPIARLPGITVLGVGAVEVKSDVALVRLAVGSGSGFSDSDGSAELIEEKQLEPVVDALVDAGARKDDIYVNTFTGTSFGPSEGAALLTIEWPRPQEVKELLDAAQRAVRKQTGFNLQQVSVTFLRDDCDGPEEKATDAALADARKRAERLASLSDMKVGRLISVSEAASAGSLAGYGPQRCGVDAARSSGELGLVYGQAGTATADEVMVTATLEVTFALEQ
jgi:uncharacterized protein YggE